MRRSKSLVSRLCASIANSLEFDVHGIHDSKFCWLLLIIFLAVTMETAKAQDTNTPSGNGATTTEPPLYFPGPDYVYPDPSDFDDEDLGFELPTGPLPTTKPATTTTTTTTTTPPKPTTTEAKPVKPNNFPDLSPIFDEISQACCAVPNLDCSFAFSRSRKRRSLAAILETLGLVAGFEDGGDIDDDDDGGGDIGDDGGGAIVRLGGRYQREGQMDLHPNATGSARQPSRLKRQAILSDQFVDHLGINLLRFETCLCQSVRPLSTCRMLFPPDFYKPSIPGVFDALFHAVKETLLKRFSCTFYNGNTVDCTFRASVRYPSIAVSDVTRQVEIKADNSGIECGMCNSFVCTFSAFSSMTDGSGGSFNTDYNSCMVNRTGLPAQVIFPPPPPTAPAGGSLPRRVTRLPPLTNSQKYTPSTIPGLSALSQLMHTGILGGLGTNLASTSYHDRYSIRPSPSFLHPPADQNHHHHGHEGFPVWKIVVAIIGGLLIGIIIMAVVICLVYRRRQMHKKHPVQRTLRDLPIVKLDVLDPSPFCGPGSGSRIGSRKLDDVYVPSGQSDSGSSYGGGSLRGSYTGGSLYRSVIHGDGLAGGSSNDGTLPVARVVPRRKQSGQQQTPIVPGVTSPSSSHQRSTSTSSSPRYAKSNKKGKSSARTQQTSGRTQQTSGRTQLSSGRTQQTSGRTQLSSARTQQTSGRTQQSSGRTQQSSGRTPNPLLPVLMTAGEQRKRRQTTARKRVGGGPTSPAFDGDHVPVQGRRSTQSNSNRHFPQVFGFESGPSAAEDFDEVYSSDEEEDEISKYRSVYAKVDDVDGDEADDPKPARSERAYDKKIIYHSGSNQLSVEPLRNLDHYEIPVKMARPRPPKPPRARAVPPAPPQVMTLPRSIAPPLPAQRRQVAPPDVRCSHWSTKTEWDPYDVEEEEEGDGEGEENVYMEIRDGDLVSVGQS